MAEKEAMKQVAKDRGISKRDVYQQIKVWKLLKNTWKFTKVQYNKSNIKYDEQKSKR
jgi:hypothetical protein